MQMFDEISSRSLDGALNVFRGMHHTLLFCGIVLAMAVLQVVMVKFGGQAMHVTENDLTAKYYFPPVSQVCGHVDNNLA